MEGEAAANGRAIICKVSLSLAKQTTQRVMVVAEYP